MFVKYFNFSPYIIKVFIYVRNYALGGFFKPIKYPLQILFFE